MNSTSHDEVTAMTQALPTTALATWSETRQNEFVRTFADRSQASRYILLRAAYIILETAERRHFIGPKHVIRAKEGRSDYFNSNEFLTEDDARRHCYRVSSVGGRRVEELETLAQERADEVLTNLPTLKDAVAVIDVETAKKLARLEVLKEQGNKNLEELNEVTQTIIISELPDTMTMLEFRTMVKDREKRRRTLIDRLNDLGEEGARLESEVYKRLYQGLPGLSDAVVTVVREHFERATAMDAMTRRVGEHVKFGQNDAAVELLRHFEKDELTVSANVATTFKTALQKLKLAGKKPLRAKGKVV
jgi:hypothetical protein